MQENFNVSLDINKNYYGEIEVNGFSRRSLISNNLWGLSPFELICGPRKIQNICKVEFDSKKFPKIIKETLRCNICLQIYNDPVNIRSCLHKFCKKCIEDYNRRIKKECAICRHSIETRRVLREDKKIKEIINCLIPNIDKFNEVEDRMINNYLPKFCFKDSTHKKSQQENTERILKCEEQGISVPSTTNVQQTNETNSQNINNSAYLQRKTSRNEKSSRTTKEVGMNINVTKSGNTIGIKLICDSQNEELKKYFNKTKLYTNEDISLEYISKYICFKQNFPVDEKEKILFYLLDDNKNKTNLDKTINLKDIRDNFNLNSNDLIKIYFNIY